MEIKSIALAATTLLVTVLMLNSNNLNATIINGSFESGDFSGWSISPLPEPYAHLGISDTEVPSTFAGILPTDGVRQALITTSPSGFESASSVKISQTFYGTKGSILSFDWNFLTEEIPFEFEYGENDFDNPFNDTAAISLYSVLASETITDNVLAEAKFFQGTTVSNNLYNFERMTGYNEYSYILPYSGDFTMSFSIRDVGDHEGNSGLLIDNVQLATVPIPASTYLFIAGLIGLARTARRKKA